MNGKSDGRKPGVQAAPRQPELVDDVVVKRIARAFQAYGFDGATLAKLSEATGLIKASLYWRFPTGKEAMAQSALKAAGDRFAEYVLKPADEPGPLADRIDQIALRLREFYRDGKRACLLETLTLAGSPDGIRGHARRTYRLWESKFHTLAIEAGFGDADAHHAAQDAIAAIEGGLVLSRLTGNGDAFRRATEALRLHLTQPQHVRRALELSPSSSV
jgi:AcrR family transcriptional regulator